MKPKNSDETFTEQFSNNIPNQLKCVDSATKYMKCKSSAFLYWQQQERTIDKENKN
jgi:DNA-directed RNA polymerase subunit M/transcription elongation factor TFIIS